MEDQPRCRRNLRAAARRRSLQGHARRRQTRLHRRRLDPDRRHQGRAGRKLGGAEGAAGRHLQAEEGHHVSGQARHHGGARADGRRCRVQLVLPPQQPATAGRPERGVQQGRGARPLHGRLLHEASTCPIGPIASATATTRRSCRRRSPTPAPATGRTSTAPARSRSPTTSPETRTPTASARTTGTRRRSTRRSSSCRSSTRSSIASSRTTRRASPRCAPASSTSWSMSAGRTWRR